MQITLAYASIDLSYMFLLKRKAEAGTLRVYSLGEAHFPDQIPNFWRYTRSSFKMATLPIPIQSKPLAMPGNDSLRLDQEQCRAPIVPQSRKPDPQDTVSPTETQPMATARTLQDQKLMPERKNVCLQSSASLETISRGEEYGQHGHGKATGRDSVSATISMRMDFLVGTGFETALPSQCRCNEYSPWGNLFC